MWYTVRHEHFLSSRVISILQWLSLVIDYHVLLSVRFLWVPTFFRMPRFLLRRRLVSLCLLFTWSNTCTCIYNQLHCIVSNKLLFASASWHSCRHKRPRYSQQGFCGYLGNSITWEKYYNKESEFWRFVAIKPSFKVPASDTPNKVDC